LHFLYVIVEINFITKSLMPRFRLLFLLLLLTSCEGYRFRCYSLCTDQTAIQNDYIEQRDRCHKYAELKVDMALKNSPAPVDEENDEKNRKSLLVSLFSECMGSNGWVVPDGKSTAANATPADKAAAEKAAAERAEKVEAKARLARNAECEFARQNASVSSISATRAKACDLECTQGMQVAPEAPRPAACPSGPTPFLSHGVEHTD
jgi:hypothetical protein